MKKENLTSLVVVVIVIAVIAAIAFVMMSKPAGCELNGNGVGVQLYDANHNPICVNQSGQNLAIVNSVNGVSYIRFTMSASNPAGNPALSCTLNNPLVKTNGGSWGVESFFTTAMSSTDILVNPAKVMQPGQTISWESNDLALDTAYPGFIGTKQYNVTISCNAYGYTSNYSSGSLSVSSIPLNIAQNQFGVFTVNISTGGIPTKYCGDGICEPEIGEIVSNCPVDCVTQTNSTFRTTDLSYYSGSAIAYNSTSSCGTALTQFGYNGQTCIAAVTGATCPTATQIGAVKTGTTWTQVFSSLPTNSNPIWGNSAVGDCAYLSADKSQLILAFQVAQTYNSPCSTVGQWATVNYATGSYPGTGSLVSNQAKTINNGLEITC